MSEQAHSAENDALREAAAIGWDACIAALKYEDGTPVEVVTMVNPYRAVPQGVLEFDAACLKCGRDNRNGTHDALERFGHLSHPFIDKHRGLHPCAGCGLELDGDDPNDRCEECVILPGQTATETGSSLTRVIRPEVCALSHDGHPCGVCDIPPAMPEGETC